MIEWQADELADLHRDLLSASANIDSLVAPVVKRGAVNIKADARRRFMSQRRTMAYLPHYYHSITFDLVTPLEAEIGPESGMKQGPFGPGVEYGSSNKGPMPHLGPALDAEEPKFVDAVGDAAVKAVGP